MHGTIKTRVSKLSDNRVTRPIKQHLVRTIASYRGSRRILNSWYSTLGNHAAASFHSRYAKLFAGDRASQVVADGTWDVAFAGQEIKLPLRPHQMWLDWDNAVSILGHDIEIKRTYASLLTQTERPTLFLDVGANYGMHSALFLSAGIPTISFEPNPNCLACFEDVCGINGYKGRWEAVALGNRTGDVELSYPEKETWLGTITEPGNSMRHDIACVTQRVPMRRLDDYLDAIPAKGALLKIDVEGAELQVLLGATQVLEHRKPKVIFESLDHQARAPLYALLSNAGYAIAKLPWRPSDHTALMLGQFAESNDTNFIAAHLN
jgi:FkbM family methyltransferase